MTKKKLVVRVSRDPDKITVWLSRRDGVRQRYYRDRLDAASDEMPRRKAKAKSRQQHGSPLLQGSVRQIVMRIKAGTQAYFPHHQLPMPILLSSARSDDYSQDPALMRRVAKISRRWGNDSPRQRTALLEAYALTSRTTGEIVLSPACTNDFRSRSYEDRLYAAVTLIHEYFHHAGQSRQHRPKEPIEEGMAQVFASMVAQRLFGSTLPFEEMGYRQYSLGTQAIASSLFPSAHLETWLLNSREATDVQRWLYDELIKGGARSDLADALAYSIRDSERDDWLAAARIFAKEARRDTTSESKSAK